MPRPLIFAIALLLSGAGMPSRVATAADEPHKAAPAAAPAAAKTHDLAAAGVADGGHSAPGHDAEAQPNILEPQASLAFWTVVVFLGLLFVLGKFAWKPLLQALHQREEHLEHVLLDTERARNESERLLAEHRRQMMDAEDRARALLDEARVQARANAEEMLQKARSEAEAEQARARREIESARDGALSEIWTRAADLAVQVAGKVLERDLGDDDRRRMVAAAIEQLPTAPVANGQGGTGA